MIESEERFDYSGVRKRLHEPILDIIPDGQEGITGVTGWILIAELAFGPESRELVAVSGNVINQSDLPVWTAKGWISEIGEDVAFYLGPDPDEEDEED